MRGNIAAVIKGIGVDLVSVKRIETAVQRYGDRLLSRVFTPAEVGYCLGKPHPFPHLAARWAAKEAFFKAMGIGWGQGLRWCEVEVKGDFGFPPQLILQGSTRERAEAFGVSEIWTSLSHEREFAVAAVVLVGNEKRG